MGLINESEVMEKSLGGRLLRWIVGGETGITSEFCSSCIMRVLPGETVKPAHSHPKGEELIYIIEGNGRVFVDGVIKPLKPETAVLFEKGSVHMVQNIGKKEMKVACFFAPRTNPSEYKFHPEIDFKSGEEQAD